MLRQVFKADITLDVTDVDSSLGVDLFYNDISDYIYVAPSNMAEDGYKVYNYLQQNATLWGGEVHYSKQTGIEWLSSYTSLEYIMENQLMVMHLPFISPLTFNQDF